MVSSIYFFCECHTSVQVPIIFTMRLITSNVFFGELAMFLLLVTLVSCNLSEESTQISANKKDIIKTKVSAYVESLCPDCFAFIHDQLAPAFSKYSDYIQLDMVPFGNAEVYRHTTDREEVHCQHGPQECLGNLYEACANHLLQDKDPKTLMNYYDCLTVNPDQHDMKKSAKACAKKLEINFETLSKCTKHEGPDLILDYGNRTEALAGRIGVPAIAFDDDFQPKEQDAILSNFVNTLCDKLKGKKPSDCKN
uniref:Gamma-interferon-inducible lysosomal thiol reductase n=2 Tax=Cacopsylla melanoneura TaxID=428564 RepID=A0A8D8YTD5_9HEMI